MEHLGIGAMTVAFGVFFLSAAIGNWNWFFQLASRRGLIGLLGRGAQRALYGGVGLAAIIFGIAFAAGLIV